ncbi:hypothetical protein BOW51_01070 [Solemya velesiana gill symbiont]|uniref:Tetratricopeptide repeat protein n=1 Tax=Solemya velesiana gill symbiont TaxID=1918948 RepID=A0A1T2KY69_9GAMM|nr:hypothetical protein BOW51_01070 [Solemya velesiana gill symbiont]
MRKPEPVQQEEVKVRPAEETGIQIRAYEPPEPPPLKPVHSRAVQSLMDQAAKQERQGALAAAVVTIERGLRIEPRNAHLWNRLAHLRYAQGQRGLAADLAAKSNTLAGRDIQLKRDNWLLIADARRSVGDIAGARTAERKARMLH